MIDDELYAPAIRKLNSLCVTAGQRGEYAEASRIAILANEVESLLVSGNCGNSMIDDKWTDIYTESGVKIEDATLPPMEEMVEIYWSDGRMEVAQRLPALEPGCGWYWQTANSFVMPGHPLLMAWRPIV